MGSSDQTPRDDDAALKARLTELSGALQSKRPTSANGGLHDGSGDASSGAVTGRAMSQGFRVLSELVAGVVVGGVIGWQLDKWLGTSPFALIVLLVLGTVSGFWNVYRLAARPTGTQAKGE